jgi:hypothetical protein
LRGHGHRDDLLVDLLDPVADRPDDRQAGRTRPGQNAAEPEDDAFLGTDGVRAAAGITGVPARITSCT